MFFSFNGSDYDYDDISPLVMIALRDNDFTDDFRNELADLRQNLKTSPTKMQSLQ